MEEFDDALPDRVFDNFQFVCYNNVKGAAEVAVRRAGAEGERAEGMKAAQFALAALMEIPDQYTIIKELGYLVGTPAAGKHSLPTRVQGLAQP